MLLLNTLNLEPHGVRSLNLQLPATGYLSGCVCICPDLLIIVLFWRVLNVYCHYLSSFVIICRDCRKSLGVLSPVVLGHRKWSINFAEQQQPSLEL